MTAGGVTRRSLLGATAGALAAGALRPMGALAALADADQPLLREQWVGSVPAGGATVALRGNADLLGVGWDGGPAGLMVRVPSPTGGLSPWVPAAACALHGTRASGASGTFIGDPLWTGGTRSVELRADRPLEGVRIFLVDASGGMGARRRAHALGALAGRTLLPLAAPVIDAGPGQPPIIARQAWAGKHARPAVAPEYGAVKLAFVHHTDNPNGYGAAEVPEMLRAIYVFHRYVHGWNDIGYNFVIDLFGRIFEARAGGIDEPVTGAQAGGYNYVSSGVAVLGTFSSRAISPAALKALERLLAWKLALHGAPAEGFVRVRVDRAGAVYSRYPGGSIVALPRVAGHRDADTTECPGTVFYDELPSLRPRVAGLQGKPAQLTLGLEPVAAPAMGAQPVAATLSGRLATIAGLPLAGASVAIQERSVERRGEVVQERTLAQAVTDSLGEWSLPVQLGVKRGGSWLRALWVGGPSGGAAVSESLHVPGALVPGSVAPGAPSGSTPAPEASPGGAGGGVSSPTT